MTSSLPKYVQYRLSVCLGMQFSNSIQNSKQYETLGYAGVVLMQKSIHCDFKTCHNTNYVMHSINIMRYGNSACDIADWRHEFRIKQVNWQAKITLS